MDPVKKSERGVRQLFLKFGGSGTKLDRGREQIGGEQLSAVIVTTAGVMGRGHFQRWVEGNLRRKHPGKTKPSAWTTKEQRLIKTKTIKRWKGRTQAGIIKIGFRDLRNLVARAGFVGLNCSATGVVGSVALFIWAGNS